MINKKIISKLMVFVFIFNLFSNLVFNRVYAAAAQLVITTSVDKASVNTGDVFTYTLKYANPSTTQDSHDVVITDVLPNNVQYVSYESSFDVQSVNAVGNTVTFTFKDPLKAGTTGYIKVAAKFPEGTTLNGTTAINTPTISDGTGTVSSNPVTVTAKTLAAQSWNVQKTLVNPASPTIPAVDQPLTYKIQVNGNSTSGGLNLTNIRVSDAIPVGSTYISSTDGGNYDSITGKVTWAPFNLNVGGAKSFYVTISYPSPTFTKDSSVTNNVTVLADDISGSTDVTKTTFATHGFTDPIYNAGTFTKSSRQANDEYSVSDTAYFYLSSISNTGNVPLNKFIITDTIPAGFNLTSITPGQFSSDCEVKISYGTSTKTDQLWGDFSNPSSQGLNVSALTLDGETITKVTWEISAIGGLPAGFTNTAAIKLSGSLLGNVVNSIITNPAQLTAQIGAVADPVKDIVKDASATIKVIDPLPWPVVTKSINGATSVNMGDTVTYDIRIENHQYATGVFINPVAIDVLPAEFENYELQGYKKNNLDYVPAVVFNQNGQELKWSFTETLNTGEYIDIIYKAKVKDKTLVGSKTNNVYVGSASQTIFQDKASATVDTVGLAPSPMVTAHVDTFVKFTGSLTSKKLVKGQLDTNWGYYGDLINGVQNYGETLPGGIADYQLEVYNNGSNGPISNIVVIDQLPNIGDIGVIDTSSRGTEWTPYLVNKIICVDDIGNQTSLPAGTKIYYSTVAHPSKVELSNSITGGNANPGGAGDGWLETPPSDITTVKSLKFDFGSYELAASGKITLQWPMRAPVGAEVSKIAWNSFGYGATYPDSTGPSSFLPSEPIKVGFEIHSDPNTYKIGNYVWEDMNKDGIQNDGDASGINGILVNLYTETTQGSGTYDNKVSYTRTGFDQNNKPGYYLFPNLPNGNYQVEFVYPTNYKVTDFNIGADATLNSKIDSLNRTGYNAAGDLDDGKYSIRAAAIIINSSDNLDQDAGLYRVATLGDYVWDDANIDSIQNDSKQPLTGIKVDLLNNSDQPVTNADGASIGQATTDATGKYLFTNLMPGSYHVKFTDPTGKFVFSDPGAADGTHSVPNKTTGIAAVTLQSNETNLKIDAGLHLAQIGDFVWHDKNADGIQNDGTSGIAGVTVSLVDVSNNIIKDHYLVDATTTTDSNGKYIFQSLDPGTYYVKFTMPSGYTKISPKNSTTFVTDSDINISTLTSDPVVLTAGQTDYTIDAGFYNLAKLGDKVWKDLNGNGLQDTTYNVTIEPGIQGVTVKLLDSAGNPVSTDGNGSLIVDQVTDINGAYSFSNLTPGTYKVKFENPDDSAYVFTKNVASNPTTDSNADSTGLTGVITLASGADDISIDAGLHKGILGDFVWTDTNGNGIQDAGEVGISNVTVNLYDNSNNKLGTTTTNGTGYYEFDDLATGTYQIEFVKPSGYQYTDINAVGTTATDSDADLTTGRTLTITKAVAGFIDNTWDAGMWKPASIGDFLWEDKNGNGIQDTGELGVNGVKVYLYKQGDLVATDIKITGDKDNDITKPGYYLFDNLKPGNYHLEFDKTGYDAFTFINKGGNSALDSDVDGLGATSTTSLISDEKDMTWDAGVYKYVTLGDKVWRDTNMNGIQDPGEPGLGNVTVNLYKYNGSSYVYKAVTTTDANGKYLFDASFNLAPGQYKVEFVKPSGYSFTLPNVVGDNGVNSDALTADGKTTAITLTSGQTDLTWDAGLYKLATVGNFVWNDVNANGIQESGELGYEGLGVQLYDENNNLKGTTTTDGSGGYSFTDIVPGKYYLKFVVPAHYALSDKDQGSNDLTDSDVDPTTLKTSIFTLTEGEDDPTWDMGIYKLSSIGDYVFEDMNADGIQDAGDKPLAGVTVQLLDANGVVKQTFNTLADGKYLFEDLKPGDYSVQFSKAGYVFSPKASGSDIAKDSNVDALGKTDKITLGLSEDRTDIDAGLYKLTSLGDYVWLDKNMDGKQDITEPGISGITVKLLDKDGAEVGNTTTDASGKYSFTNLVPGDYSLEFVSAKDFYKHTEANIGDDSKDSDADKVSGKTSTITLKSGDNNLTLDAGFTVKTGITIEKTVYAGHDGGKGTGTELVIGEKGTLVTYLFKVTNTGDTYLNNVEIQDTSLGSIDKSKMTVINGIEPLAPGASLLYYYETAINGDLTNTANTTGTPSDNLGVIVPDIDKPTALDTAVVDEVKPGIDVQKSIYLGKYNSGTSLGETASGKNGEWVTYVFTVTNTGDTYLKDLVINDVNLSIDKSKMTLISGVEPLAPGAVIHYYYETKINGDLTNTVTVTGTPSFAEGTIVPNTKNPTAEDTANAKALGSIGDYFWYDNNGDGKQDLGEPSLAGVTVNLLDNESKLVATATTDSNGKYIFDRLIPGEYTVVVDTSTLPIGLKQTYELDGSKDGSVKVTLTPGVEIDTADFGYYKLGAIGNYVWGDINGNGIQDVSEIGIKDVIVKLCKADGTEVLSTTTDENGLYEFDNLVLGDYYIQFVKPVGYEISRINTTEDKTIDSDAASDGKTTTIKVIAGTNDMTWDAGLYVPASVGDYLWYDSNLDKKQDSWETAIEGVKLNLLDKDGLVIATKTTDSNGKYIFDKLIPGDYTVVVDTTTLPGGLGQTYELDDTRDGKVMVSLTPGQVIDTVDFGYYVIHVVQLGLIGNYVWEDTNVNGIQDLGEKGIKDVIVNLYKADGTLAKTAITDVNGLYKFENLYLGDYYVEFVKPVGYAITSKNITTTKELDNNADINGKTQNINVVDGTNDMSWDAGMYKLSSVGDYVWYDKNGDGIQNANEKGIPDVKVILTDALGKVTTTVTDNMGKYIFENLAPGSYTVSIDKTTLPKDLKGTYELDRILDGVVVVTLASGEFKDNVDFGYNKNGVGIDDEVPGGGGDFKASLGDYVWYDLNGDGKQDSNEKGIAGVKIILTNSQGISIITTTDNSGKYIFENLPLGKYTVTLDKATLPKGLKETYELDKTLNGNVEVTLITAAFKQDVDFGYNRNGIGIDDEDIPGGAGDIRTSVGDYVWYDANGNGKQEPNEKGIAGVRLILTDFYGNERTTITDSLGKYIFEDLPIAKYIIIIDKTTLPKGMKETYELDKTLDGKVEVTLLTAEFRDDVDFGYNKKGVGIDDDKIPASSNNPSTPDGKNLPKTGTENYNLLLSGILMLLLSSGFILFYRRKES